MSKKVKIVADMVYTSYKMRIEPKDLFYLNNK